MKVTVLYFALLKQRRGLSEECVQTDAASVGGLYQEVNARHGLGMEANQIKLARNEDFCAASEPLADGDTVAFMPPVSGG